MQEHLPSDPRRPTAAWYVSWLIPAMLGVIALATIEHWLPAPFPSLQTADVQTFDQEHDAFCQKYGPATASAQLVECKAALLQIRNRNRVADVLFF